MGTMKATVTMTWPKTWAVICLEYTDGVFHMEFCHLASGAGGWLESGLGEGLGKSLGRRLGRHWGGGREGLVYTSKPPFTFPEIQVAKCMG